MENENKEKQSLDEFKEYRKNEFACKIRKRVIIRVSVIILACLLVYFINFEENSFYSCLIRRFTGYYCPACGMTRAAHYLMRLDIARAFAYNQFFVITIPFFAYIITADSINAYSGRKILPLFKFNKYAALVIIGLFLVYGILRNVEALSFLAPHKLQ